MDIKKSFGHSLARRSAFLGLLLGCASVALAGVPQRITYQGNLRESGILVTGTRSMVFRLFASSTSAGALWTSAATAVTVSTGVFRVILEPAGVDWEASNPWLELEVAGTALAPREELTTNPYAVNSLLHSGKRYTNSAVAPAAPGLGDLWFDTAASTLKVWTGASFASASGAGAAHAATHAGGGVDPITSLGAHALTGDITMSAGASLAAAAGNADVRVSSHLVVSPGNLGIGTTTPTHRLDLNGGAIFRSSTSWAGMDAPPVSPAGQGTLYFDATASKFKASENAGGYVDLIGAGAGGGWTEDAGNNKIYATDTGRKVGIGTTSPGEKLHLSGANGAGDMAVRFEHVGVVNWVAGLKDSDNSFRIGQNPSLGTNDLFVITPDRFVGIGATSPSGELHIDATPGGVDNAVEMIGQADRSGAGQTLFDIIGRWGSTSVGQISFFSGADTANKDEGKITIFTRGTDGYLERMRIEQEGNVGIGTTSPAAKLHVSSGTLLVDGDASTSFRIGTSSLVALASGGLGLGTTAPSEKLHLSGANGSGDMAIRFEHAGTVNWVAGLKDSDNSFRIGQNPSLGTNDLLVITADRTVGIGATVPEGELHIDATPGGAANAAEIVGQADRSGADESLFEILAKWGSTYVGMISFTTGADATNKDEGKMRFFTRGTDGHLERMRIEQDGKVGIGTTSPAAQLDVANDGGFIRLHSAAGADGIMFGTTAGDATMTWPTTKKLFFGQYSNNSVAVIDNNTARVGIGTTAPTRTLTVSGGVCVDDPATGAGCPANVDGEIAADGAITANAFDLAERFEAEDSLEPGDVVVASDRPGRVRKSDQAHSGRVLGIVSRKPGFILGFPDSGVPVALLGRVPVKATTENGPIQVGDLLVASSKPGHAMRALDPKPGTVVGKALQPLAAGAGEILVYVMLK